jgi:hypothetical protein
MSMTTMMTVATGMTIALIVTAAMMAATTTTTI